MRTTNIRFTGLASGLDTESMVQSMVMPYKMKVDTKWQEQTKMEWRKDAWKDMNKKLFTFYDQTISKLRLESTFNKKNISVSNKDAIQINPNSTLPEGTHTINSIDQLAESAKLNTSALKHKDPSQKVTSKTAFKDLQPPITEKITLRVSDSVDEKGNPIYKEISIDGESTIGDLKGQLTSALKNTNVNFDEGVGAFFISSKKTGKNQFLKMSAADETGNDKSTDVFKALGIDIAAGKNTVSTGTIKSKDGTPITKDTNLLALGLDNGSIGTVDANNRGKLQFKIGGNTIEVTLRSNLTLEELEKEVNDAVNLEIKRLKNDDKGGNADKIKDLEGFEFSFDEKNGKFSIGGTSSIEAAIIPGAGGSVDSKNVLGKLGIVNVAEAEITGKNAIVFYNGIQVESETNTISVNGFNFDIKATTAKTGEEITVISTFDTDAVVETMKNFVDEYNKLIEEIHNKLGASSSKGYEPLTAEQKKEMSEADIEAWEKKIKDSLFRKDPDLQKVTDTMRQLLGGVVEGGVFSTFSEIGITTGDWKEKGKLHFDEDKFRKALAQDTDAVVQMIAGSGDPKGLYEKEMKAGAKSWDDLVKSELAADKELVSKYQNRTKGFGDRLYETIQEATRSTTLRSAYSFYNDKALDKQISQAKKDVKELEERMYRMEDMYYKKFTAMEKMMSQLNNQSSWLTSQLGGM